VERLLSRWRIRLLVGAIIATAVVFNFAHFYEACTQIEETLIPKKSIL
jgi:hypothetical protein